MLVFRFGTGTRKELDCVFVHGYPTENGDEFK